MGPESKLVIEQLIEQPSTFDELVSILADDGAEETSTVNMLHEIVDALVLNGLVRVRKST